MRNWAVIEDAAEAPKGTIFTEETDWVEDSFRAVAPEKARSVKLRAAICGKGKVFAGDIMFFG